MKAGSRRARFAAALLALATSGCSGGRGVLLVILESRDRIDNIAQLFVEVDNGGQQATAVFPFGSRSVSIPPTQSFSLVLEASRRGQLQVLVEALDRDNDLLADGEGRGEVVPGQRREITIRLDPLVAGQHPDLGSPPGGD